MKTRGLLLKVVLLVATLGVVVLLSVLDVAPTIETASCATKICSVDCTAPGPSCWVTSCQGQCCYACLYHDTNGKGYVYRSCID